MKAVIFCFVALFAGALATPQISEDLDDRIIGGNVATIEEYPYQISLRLNGTHKCGGSVLTTTRALTAASCLIENVSPSQYSIKAGSTYRLDIQGDRKSQLRTLSRFVIHPSYHKPTHGHDAAVLQWIQPLVFGASVQPIVLPSATYAMPYGKLAVTSGYGYVHAKGPNAQPQRLQAIETPVWNNTICNQKWHGRVKPEMVCAGFSEPGRAPCFEDYGGPLADKSRGRFVLIGVVSWGACGALDSPTVYSRVPHLRGWIRANLY